MDQARQFRAILWDVHGALLDYNVDPPHSAPNVRRKQWASWTQETLLEEGAPPKAIREERLNPLAFWRRRMKVEFQLPKTRRTLDGVEIISERSFRLSVNLALLRWIAPSFMRSRSAQDSMRLAYKLWMKRRTDQHRYVLHPDMRELLQWCKRENIVICFVSASARRRVDRLLRRCNVSRDLYTCVYVSGDVGLPKPHPAFWREIKKRLGLPAEEIICIEDDPAIGKSALSAGMALLLHDADGEIDAFLRQELGGVLGGASMLNAADPIPSTGLFVMCARGPHGLRQSFEAMRQAGS